MLPLDGTHRVGKGKLIIVLVKRTTDRRAHRTSAATPASVLLSQPVVDYPVSDLVGDTPS